ncbi:hypothetical protein [Neomegalonema sp.]|uniref:hypothetical protein n=1 Tax=Neomegalonema sp. TaxID=2039713 RepID=UPI002603E0F2|nr:hypothetical protein [Neomegalonema sp.]MDD2869261.1 hypothetical protein [Neomegalonema sp.]
MASGVSGGSAYQGGVPSGPFVAPGFSYQTPSAPYAPRTEEAEAKTRASIPAPHRPLPQSHAADSRASILGGRLDAIATPNDAPPNPITALAGAATGIVGGVTGVIGNTLNFFGLQKPLTDMTATLLSSPLFSGAMRLGLTGLGLGAGVGGALIGEKNVSDIVGQSLNTISSEKGGAALASPALEEMKLGGPGWKGVLDGLLAENAGMNLYSTAFLGNLKNRTDGGTGPEFYKQLVVDTWDANPAGREFLASVGKSALSREDAAKWYAEYYYDILDQEDGSGVATKVADTLDYRFGLDADNMNKVYAPGADRANAYARAFPEHAADIMGDPGLARRPEAGKDAASTAPTTRGGLSPANSSAPTGPEYSGTTSHTRAYRNAPGDGGPLGRLASLGTTSAISLLAGPGVAALGGLFGREGAGKIAATAFDQIFSKEGGSAFGGFIDGLRAAPGGDATAAALVKGALSSGAGTALTITSAQQFPKAQDGVDFFRGIMTPLRRPGADGRSVFDRVMEEAPNNEVLANNLRAVAEEWDESLSAKNMLKEVGMEGSVKRIRDALPVNVPYAYMRQGPHADLELNDPRRLPGMFDTALPDDLPLVDSAGKPTEFGNVGLRLFGHDVLDGKVDGDVTLRTLLNPVGSGNDDFRRNLEYVKKWGQMDLRDDGALNGSALRSVATNQQTQAAANPAPAGISGASGAGSPAGAPSMNGVTAPHGPKPGGDPGKCPFLAAQSAFKPDLASPSQNLMQDVRQTFDFKNPGVKLESYDALAQNYGFNRNELADLILWGHTVSKLPGDPAARNQAFDSYVQRALDGDDSLTSFDQVFVRDVPGLRDHYQSRIGNFDQFNADVGKLLARMNTAGTPPQA